MVRLTQVEIRHTSGWFVDLEGRRSGEFSFCCQAGKDVKEDRNKRWKSSFTGLKIEKSFNSILERLVSVFVA